MLPPKRIVCLYCTPIIVLYAEALLIGQYIFGLNLTNEELPEQLDGGYQLKQIGFEKFTYPALVLAVKVDTSSVRMVMFIR